MVGSDIVRCILSIAKGEQCLLGAEIYDNTMKWEDHEWLEFIERCNKGPWKDYPHAEDYFWILWRTGKIHQYRLFDKDVHVSKCNSPLWAEKVGDLTFIKQKVFKF